MIIIITIKTPAVPTSLPKETYSYNTSDGGPHGNIQGIGVVNWYHKYPYPRVYRDPRSTSLRKVQPNKKKIFSYTLFFISNARFFQLSLSVAQLFHELSFKCCLHITIIMLRHHHYTSIFVSISRPRCFYVVSM